MDNKGRENIWLEQSDDFSNILWKRKSHGNLTQCCLLRIQSNTCLFSINLICSFQKNIPKLQSERSKIFYSGNNLDTDEYYWSSANGVRAKMELLRETFVYLVVGVPWDLWREGGRKEGKLFRIFSHLVSKTWSYYKKTFFFLSLWRHQNSDVVNRIQDQLCPGPLTCLCLRVESSLLLFHMFLVSCSCLSVSIIPDSWFEAQSLLRVAQTSRDHPKHFPKL